MPEHKSNKKSVMPVVAAILIKPTLNECFIFNGNANYIKKLKIKIAFFRKLFYNYKIYFFSTTLNVRLYKKTNLKKKKIKFLIPVTDRIRFGFVKFHPPFSSSLL